MSAAAKIWNVGRIRITRIIELGGLTAPPEWILVTDADVVRKHDWLVPDYATPDGQIVFNMQAFVIEANGRKILVDPCVGNHKPRHIPMFANLETPFLERLQAAGFAPESIDLVLCTHLHLDHVGWNTRLENGQWVPTFPNARYLFGKVEYESARTDVDGDAQAAFADSIKPIIDAGLADLVDVHHRISENVWLEPTPGHTAGHCSIYLASDGEAAVISGDVLHHPLQAAEPDVCSNFCADHEKARKTRRAFLERHAGSRTLILGTHFAEPTGVQFRADGDVWRVEAAETQFVEPA